MIDNIFVFEDALTPEQVAYIRNYGAPAILKGASRARRTMPAILKLLLLSD